MLELLYTLNGYMHVDMGELDVVVQRGKVLCFRFRRIVLIKRYRTAAVATTSAPQTSRFCYDERINIDIFIYTYISTVIVIHLPKCVFKCINFLVSIIYAALAEQ